MTDRGYWRLFVDAEACSANMSDEPAIANWRVLQALRQELGAVEGWDQDQMVFHLRSDPVPLI